MFTIEEYKEAVCFFASSHKDFMIKNEGNDCARIILSNIFLNATKTLRIVANNLRNEVVDSKEYQDGLDSFLSRDGSVLKIIINELPDNVTEDSNANIYRRLSRNPAYQTGRIQIKTSGKNLFFLKDKPIHFCVADSIMYRVEDDIVKRMAICNFGDSKLAERLESAFDAAFNSIQGMVELKKLFE